MERDALFFFLLLMRSWRQKGTEVVAQFYLTLIVFNNKDCCCWKQVAMLVFGVTETNGVLGFLCVSV